MKYLLKSFILFVSLSFSGFAFAEAVIPSVNKGDTACMIVSTVLVILMFVP
jgi:hypothetical protein